MRVLLKPLSFIPALVLMYLIFSFSADEGVDSAALSYKVSRKIVEVVDTLGEFQWPEDRINHYAERIHGKVRKLAHMTEYAALAVAVSLPLYVYGLHGILLMIVAGGFCVLFAASDEFHQLYVAGRSGSLRDVAIDSIGILAGIIFVRIVGFTGRMTIFRKPKKRKRHQSSYQNRKREFY